MYSVDIYYSYTSSIHFGFSLRWNSFSSISTASVNSFLLTPNQCHGSYFYREDQSSISSQSFYHARLCYPLANCYVFVSGISTANSVISRCLCRGLRHIFQHVRYIYFLRDVQFIILWTLRSIEPTCDLCGHFINSH